MDAEEKKLTDAYNKAVDELKNIRKGDEAQDEAHFAASRKLIKAMRALEAYKNRK